MFVLVSFREIKQKREDRIASVENKKKIAATLLESVREPSSDHDGELMQR